MKNNILIVDAYNMIGNWPKLDKLKKAGRLEEARNQLLHILANYRRLRNYQRMIVVFDAMYVPGLAENYQKLGMEIIWTAEDQTADSYIEALTEKLQSRLTLVTVATSDQAEQWTIFSKGAIRISAWEFYQDIKRAQQEVAAQSKKYQSQASVRHVPWDDEQLKKLEKFRHTLEKKPNKKN
jgi:predicted RNA-binding protein with PIN domain